MGSKAPGEEFVTTTRNRDLKVNKFCSLVGDTRRWNHHWRRVEGSVYGEDRE